MHILLYCDDPGLGGTFINAALLAEGLVRAGHIVSLACEVPAGACPPNVSCLPLGYDTVRNPAKAQYSRNEPEAILLARRPDMVFFCDGAPDSSLAAKTVCRTWGIPYLVMVNYVAPDVAATVAKAPCDLADLLQAALAVVAVSTDNLRLLRRHCGLSEGHSGVIYNGRPRAFFTPPPPGAPEARRRELGLGPEAVLCLTVARFEPRKGYAHLVQAVSRLAGQAAGERLYFVCMGHDIGEFGPALVREVARRGLSSRFFVLGQRDDVREWLAAADIFILPSESEGMPLCIIEAMGQGLPVVATAVSGVPEQLGDTGVLLPDPLRDADGMVAALVRAVSWLADEPDSRRRLGEAARNRALSFFTAEKMLADYAGLLASLAPAVAAARPRYPDPAQYRPPQVVPLGRDLPMGDDRQVSEFLKAGWSTGEGEGRWTDGPCARLVLLLPETWNGGLILDFEARPFLGKDDASLGLRVLCCGRELATYRLRDRERLTRFTLAYFPDGPLPDRIEIRFELDGVSSPLAQGLSDDARQLGLWLTRLRLDSLVGAPRTL